MAGIAGGDATPLSSEFGRIARNSSDFERAAPSCLMRSSCEDSHDYKPTDACGISGLRLYPCSPFKRSRQRGRFDTYGGKAQGLH